MSNKYSISELRELFNQQFKIHLSWKVSGKYKLHGFYGFQTFVSYFDSGAIECMFEKAMRSKKDKIVFKNRGFITVTLYSK